MVRNAQLSAFVLLVLPVTTIILITTKLEYSRVGHLLRDSAILPNLPNQLVSQQPAPVGPQFRILRVDAVLDMSRKQQVVPPPGSSSARAGIDARVEEWSSPCNGTGVVPAPNVLSGAQEGRPKANATISTPQNATRVLESSSNALRKPDSHVETGAQHNSSTPSAERSATRVSASSSSAPRQPDSPLEIRQKQNSQRADERSNGQQHAISRVRSKSSVSEPLHTPPPCPINSTSASANASLPSGVAEIQGAGRAAPCTSPTTKAATKPGQATTNRTS